jgi:acyl-CoA synthetase (AMP-forming)/AMP-acid ligase II
VADVLHTLTIGDVARENARRFPQRAAIVCGATRLSYPELDERTTRLANALTLEGVGPGDRVLWLGQNCHRVLELLVACSKIGAALGPVNWRQRPGELAFALDDASPRLVVAQRAEVGDAVAEARARVGATCRWLFHDDEGPDSYEAFLAGGSAEDLEAPVGSSASVLMIYTSAFAGSPNGALLSSTALIGMAMLTGLSERLDHDDVFLVSGPLFHIGCWRYVLTMFLLGGVNVFFRRVDAEECCRLVDAEHCTHAYLFTSTQEQMVVANRDGRYDLSSLRALPGSPEWNAMVAVEPNPWLDRPERYGQTEIGGIAAYGAFGPPPLGGHGRAAPLGQLRLVDDDGLEVAVGEVGEFVARGPMVMNGYHNRPELNAESLAGGWRRTNDLGRREPDGSCTFVGPKARMLKCGMENVYPAEVEQALRTHPDVAECAVIGVPDDTFIQVVKAIVVPTAGSTPAAEELVAYAREHLAAYKAPKSVELVTELPRADTGVDYEALDARFGGGNYPGGTTRTR